MTTATATKTHPLVAAHAEAIAKREAATTPGVAAGASRKIASLELEMVIAGIEFTPWTPPIKPSSRKPTRTDEDLLARIDVLRTIMNDPQHPQRIRDTAEQHLRGLLDQASKRGIEVPDATTAKSTKRQKVAA